MYEQVVILQLVGKVRSAAGFRLPCLDLPCAT